MFLEFQMVERIISFSVVKKDFLTINFYFKVIRQRIRNALNSLQDVLTHFYDLGE